MAGKPSSPVEHGEPVVMGYVPVRNYGQRDAEVTTEVPIADDLPDVVVIALRIDLHRGELLQGVTGNVDAFEKFAVQSTGFRFGTIQWNVIPCEMFGVLGHPNGEQSPEKK